MTGAVAAKEVPFPKTLDIFEWIQFTFDQGEKMNRLLAMEALSMVPIPPGMVDRLKDASENDQALRCREMAKNLLESEKIKARAAQLASQVQFSPDSLKAFLVDFDPLFRQAFIKSLRKSPPPEILDLWRSEFLKEIAPEIAGVGLSILARFGIPSDVNFALPFLGSARADLAIAAIDLLYAQNLDLFKNNLTKILEHPNVDVQMHGIGKLRGIDRKQEVLLLKPFFKSPDPLVRQRALRQLVLLPWEEAEFTYFQFLSTETRPLPLVMAGWAIASNPNPELPLRIFDVMLVSQGIKKHILQLVLNQVVDSISKTGILQEPVEKYITELKALLQKRRDSMLKKISLEELNHSDMGLRQKAIQQLSIWIAHPEVEEALRKRFSEEPNVNLKNLIGSILKSEKVGDEEIHGMKKVLPESLKSKRFLDFPPENQRLLIKTIRDRGDFQAVKEYLIPLLSRNINWTVLLEIINCISIFGDQQDLGEVLPLTQHSEPAVATEAIKLCARLNPNSIKPLLEKLLQNVNPQVKAAAFENFLLLDTQKALEYLEGMVNSNSSDLHREAISLLTIVDDFSASPILMQMFLGEVSTDLKIRIGEMLMASPTEEKLQVLFQGSHSPDGTEKKEFKNLWEFAIRKGSETLGIDREKFEVKCREELSKPQQSTLPPEFSYQKFAANASLATADGQGKAPEAVIVISKPIEEQPLPQSLVLDEWALYCFGQTDELKRYLAL